MILAEQIQKAAVERWSVRAATPTGVPCMDNFFIYLFPTNSESELYKLTFVFKLSLKRNFVRFHLR